MNVFELYIWLVLAQPVAKLLLKLNKTDFL